MGLRTLFARLGVLAALDKAPYPANAAKRTAAAEAAVTALDGVTAADVSAASWADMHGDLPPKFYFLGSAGGVLTVDATTQTASSTTAVYYEVPAGKVAYVWRLKGLVYDMTAAVSTMHSHFGATAAPSTGNGLRIRTVDTDTTTTLTTLASSAENNLSLLITAGTPLSEWKAADGDTPTATTHLGAAVKVDWKFAQPLVLTAGQRFEVKHLASVAYTRGVWAVEVSEVTL